MTVIVDGFDHISLPLNWNSSTFPDQSPHWYRYNNHSTIYCDSRYPLDFSCNATFSADPDIAGPGVVVGFIATAWYTIIVASIAATHRTIGWWREMRQQPPTPTQPIALNDLSGANSSQAISSTPDEHRAERFAKLLLNSLCDLQLITGMAIIVAGLTQMPEISYYHEQLVIDYWNLTLNSFWAARGGYTADYYHDGEPNKSTSAKCLRALVRMVAIAVSSVLSVAFQGLALVRENGHWDPLQSGRCYRSGDHSGAGQARFWIVGVSVFALVVVLCFIPAIEGRIRLLSKKRTKVYGACKRWQKTQYDSLKTPISPSRSWIKRRLQIIAGCSKLVFFVSLRTFFWLLIQFLSIWSYGEGFYPFEIVCYTAFAGWNTGNIIDLKVRNAELLEGLENKWGFGQVLPTALLGMVVFNTIDAFRGEVSMKS
ncbi:MAG: hypothetical protein M1840_000072 [Geoglossum simile]|nr:MAG: hypothetical protein M1840_000072 [Geoglossum simile]